MKAATIEMRGHNEESGPSEMALLPRFGTLAEMNVVLALLRDGGIPVVCRDWYEPRNPEGQSRLLVPRGRLEEAIGLIEEARNRHAAEAAAPQESVEEPRSPATAVIWLLALGAAAVALGAASGVIGRLVERWFR